MYSSQAIRIARISRPAVRPKACCHIVPGALTDPSQTKRSLVTTPTYTHLYPPSYTQKNLTNLLYAFISVIAIASIPGYCYTKQLKKIYHLMAKSNGRGEVQAIVFGDL